MVQDGKKDGIRTVVMHNGSIDLEPAMWRREEGIQGRDMEGKAMYHTFGTRTVKDMLLLQIIGQSTYHTNDDLKEYLRQGISGVVEVGVYLLLSIPMGGGLKQLDDGMELQKDGIGGTSSR